MASDESDGPSRSWRTSLGNIGAAIVLGGSLGAVGILGFLLFLWTGEGTAGGAGAPKVWRWIVINDLLTQVATLCSAFLRIILVLQAMMSTSLIAAVLLEGPGYSVPLSKAAELSITRSVNSGPFSLARLMFFSPRWFVSSSKLPIFLTGVLIFLTMASQFLSTLLVADLKTGPLIGFPDKTQLFVDKKPGNKAPVDYYNYLEVPPLFIPFGELTSPSDMTPTADGLSDTGPVQRVFLPVDETNRTTIRSYAGKAYVVSTRYACLPPAVTSAALLKFPVPGSTRGAFINYFAGNISYDMTFAGAGLDFACPTANCFFNQSIFGCSMAHIDTNSPNKPLNGPHPAFSICSLDRSNAFYADQNLDYTHAVQEKPVHEYSQVFLAFQTNLTDETVRTTLAPQGNITFPTNYTRKDEFITWEFDNMEISMSVCFQTFIVDIADVKMTTDRDLGPPAGGWDFDLNTWDTSSILPYFGISPTPLNASARGIYQVNRAGNLTNLTSTTLWDTYLSDVVTLTAGTLSYNSVMDFGPDMVGRRDSIVNDQTAAVVTDIMKQTGRPALALMTLGTMSSMNALSLPRPKLDLPANVTIVHSAFVPVPHSWRGLFAVTAIVMMSLAVSNTAVVLFLRWTNYTVRGDYWHAVSQSVSDETRWILDESSEMADGEVSRMLGDRGNTKVRIRRVYNEKKIRPRVQFVAV